MDLAGWKPALRAGGATGMRRRPPMRFHNGRAGDAERFPRNLVGREEERNALRVPAIVIRQPRSGGILLPHGDDRRRRAGLTLLKPDPGFPGFSPQGLHPSGSGLSRSIAPPRASRTAVPAALPAWGWEVIGLKALGCKAYKRALLHFPRVGARAYGPHRFSPSRAGVRPLRRMRAIGPRSRPTTGPPLDLPLAGGGLGARRHASLATRCRSVVCPPKP